MILFFDCFDWCGAYRRLPRIWRVFVAIRRRTGNDSAKSLATIFYRHAADSPQTEQTPFRPASPYGCAKAFATQLARVYRQAYGLFVCNGILYNHESPRRGEHFVTRKIARAAA
jgi:GDP-D-mannose dehydratase